MNKTNRVINLGLIQWSDPFDRKAMSGTPYKMAEALRAVGFNVVWVPAKKTLALRMYTKAVNLLNKFSRKQTKPSHTKIGASLLSGTLDRTIIDSCGVPAAAQDAVVKRIIEIGKTDNRVMHQIDILTNRFGGRVLGSDAFENAAEWMVREYKSWGLDVDLEEAGTLPVGFNRGPWFGRMLGENSMHLHFVTPSYTSGTKGAQAWVKSHPEGLGRISNMFNRDGGSEPPVGIYVPQAMYDDFVKICAPI